jgi:hypothetical protein
MLAHPEFHRALAAERQREALAAADRSRRASAESREPVLPKRRYDAVPMIWLNRITVTVSSSETSRL